MKNQRKLVIHLIHRYAHAIKDGLKVVSVMLLVFCALTVTGPLTFAFSAIDPLF